MPIPQKIAPPAHNFYESQAWETGQVVCGIDEVGVGALAGPVVAGAVILPPETSYHLLKDSKKMSEKQRSYAYEWITTHCQWAVGIEQAAVIDTINILQATKKAMRQALLSLLKSAQPTNLDCILVDAVIFPHGTPYHYYAFNFGESSSASIAAASIIAKVTRDRLMKDLDPQYPQYGFASHKGYGSKFHREKIAEFGASAEHRLSFCKNILGPQTTVMRQKSIFED